MDMEQEDTFTTKTASAETVTESAITEDSTEAYQFRAERTIDTASAESASNEGTNGVAQNNNVPLTNEAAPGQLPPPGQFPPPGCYNPYYYHPGFPPQAPVPRPKKEHRFLKKFVSCIALAACFGLVAGGTFLGVQYAYGYLFPEKAVESKLPVLDNKKTDKLPDFTIPTVSPVETTGESDGSDIVAKVVEQTMPAMVSINSTVSQTIYYFGRPYVEEDTGSGSGIIVGSNDTDLLIATNYHVIEGATSLEAVLADGTKHTISVKGGDPDADLAIVALPLSSLSAETLEKIDIAILGDSDSAQVGQMVIAIGNALGYGRSVTVGYLSAKDREIDLNGSSMTLLQTNAAINPGNSGGALLNTKGEVIGINNAKISSTSIEGICFAIPISKATPILEDLMTREILSDEEKGYLGVTVQELDSVMYQLYNWPEGVYVSSVVKGGSAELAGIYPGDIITHVNGGRVTTANQLINSVTSHRYGETVEITLQRISEGKFVEQTFTITLQKKPETTENSKQ